MFRALHDRPFMGFFRSSEDEIVTVTEEDSIFQWAARQFGGEQIGEIIIWNNDAPEDKSQGDNCASSGNSPAYVRVNAFQQTGATKGEYCEFELLWENLAFELNNASTSAKMKPIVAEATKGTISRQAFIDTAARLEFLSAKKTERFYRTIWMPWAERRSFVSDESVWSYLFAKNFDDWVKQYSGEPDFPLGYLGKMYDRYCPKKRSTESPKPKKTPQSK